MTITPHDHRMWAVIGLYTGREDNIFWRRIKGDPQGQVEAAGARALCVGDAEPLGQNVIHSVTNPIPRLTGAIHVYGGDFFAAERGAATKSHYVRSALTSSGQSVDLKRQMQAITSAKSNHKQCPSRQVGSWDFAPIEDKADAEFSTKGGRFHDRDLYITVLDLDGKVLAHGQREDLIGKGLIELKDPDGKLFIRERVELARRQPSFWQNYKFMNPATKKVEPKQMYCERLSETAVCGGVYSF